jgi:putative two-component system response regulator
MSNHIMFVDDEPAVLDALRRVLHEYAKQWMMTFVQSGEEAWQRLLQEEYDAVVADIKMPGLNGLELLRRLREHEKTNTVPVVFLTGLNQQDLKQKALELGAVDLLNKPVDKAQLVARIGNVLRQKSYEDQLRQANALLEQKIQRQNAALAQARLSVVCRLAKAAEVRDEQTGNHVIRVGCYSRAIAAAMNLEPAIQEMLLLAAPLHDIGKIGIPDRILLKRGPLSDGEWAVVQRHCVIGYRILSEPANLLQSLLERAGLAGQSHDMFDQNDPLLELAASIALTHHEKWDGTGYPLRLCGSAIPLASRIVAVADVFDALVSPRPYRGPCEEQQALRTLQQSAGSHFDPEVHAAFCQAIDDIRAIRNQLADDRQVFVNPDFQWL